MMSRNTKRRLERLFALCGALALSVAAMAQEHGAEAGGEGHGGGNLLTEHPAGYYSGVGFLVALFVILFCARGARATSARQPGRAQLLMEQGVASMRHFCRGAIGPGGEKFAPFVGTVFAFLLCCNLCGVLPFYLSKSPEPGGAPVSLTPAPSANLSMTLAMGLIVFVLFNVVGIRANGAKKYFAHFAGPIWWLSPLMLPIELIGVLVRPISLGMRLFGNIFGEETVIAVLIGMAASTFIIPLHAPMLAFGVFGGVVQAGVFSILTCSYIALAIGDHGDDHGDGGHGHAGAHAH